MHLITWIVWVTTCLQASRLMSSPFWAATLEVVPEARWWIWSPPSTSCSFAAIALGALVLSCCCFSLGAVVACCILSHQCRQWLWHCFWGALQQWAYSQPRSRPWCTATTISRVSWMRVGSWLLDWIRLRLNLKHFLPHLHIQLELLQLLALRLRDLKLKVFRHQFLLER